MNQHNIMAKLTTGFWFKLQFMNYFVKPNSIQIERLELGKYFC